MLHISIMNITDYPNDDFVLASVVSRSPAIKNPEQALFSQEEIQDVDATLWNLPVNAPIQKFIIPPNS